ncbi:copper-translocating P-type ATPase [Lactobacillus sp. ZJLC29-4]|uniref:P-type Cu(+) transporter n=2 Tax=Levilactobacillus tujiorum TaxID=2912243 RepID=A0ABX1L452_9LACO|nr:heavy metal translocating P-type ATPase [Levilactobacillus tujiorum]MCH5465221.1 copper-translocating P-type ATPase [Levilactobacillus tujiorum]NLR12222.1 copper-translocating P-type ATPase [Lactobacillus sp. HBUAS51387]NLR29800.1 copper-translocating P-type ATPase [Levilactobacillus tujiorum]
MKGMDHSQRSHDDMDMANMDHHDMSHMDMSDMDMDMGDGHMMHMGNLKRKFWVSLILTIPVILMSPMMGMTLPFQLVFPGSDWVVAILGTILFFYGGAPFFSGAKAEIQMKQPAMMTLISMGVGVAYIYSIYAVIANNLFHVTPTVNNFFWELSTLIVIMLLGHWIEMNTVMNAGSAVDALGKLLPQEAHVVDDQGQVTDVKLSDLQVGQIVSVRAGEQIPADAKIITGSSDINESLVTGESKAIRKSTGDTIIGGSVNGTGTFTAKVTGTGDSGYLAQVMALIKDAKHAKSKSENLADRVAGWLFYAALFAGILAFIVWLTVANLAVALPVAVAVFVIACPHALGLAVPLVVSRSTALAAQNGLLIRNRTAMEQVNQLKYALMDKTGTLTMGEFKVNHLISLDTNHTEAEILDLMASLENGSSHPLATGILTAAKAQQLSLTPAEDTHQETGLGQFGTIAGTTYGVVSVNYLDQHQLAYDHDQFTRLAGEGNSISYLVASDQVLGLVAQGDQIKPAAAKLVASLKKQGITPVMLTGDNQETAAKVAAAVGIDEVQARLLPEDKERLVQQYQKTGKVLFIGDGVNDAPSLARADIGMAIGSGTDVAIESADIILVSSDPADVIQFLDLARATHRKMTENLWWGAGYNLIAIPLAAGVLAPLGFMLDPMVGAIVMSLSTVIVAINAMTLKIKDVA